MTSTFLIGDRTVGGGRPAFLVAEIAQAHDGSLGMAHAFVDAAADAGADAIKFQTHIAAAESTRQEQFRVKFSQQDETRYEYWKRVEFTPAQWRELAEHARSRKLAFLSSPFSLQAVELLSEIGVPAWKVASGEITTRELLEPMARSGRPLMVSTGMSPWAEIEQTVADLRRMGASFCLMQCTSKYPTSLDEVGLNVMEEYRRRFGCPVGLSDHSGTPFPALAALARRCDVVELHLTLDRRMFGPDVSSSLTVPEFRLLADARDAFQRIDSHPVDKDAMAASLAAMRGLFMRSAAPTRELAAGTVLAADMITAKKPGTGIPASDIPKLVGRKLRRAVSADQLFSPEDLGD